MLVFGIYLIPTELCGRIIAIGFTSDNVHVKITQFYIDYAGEKIAD